MKQLSWKNLHYDNFTIPSVLSLFFRGNTCFSLLWFCKSAFRGYVLFEQLTEKWKWKSADSLYLIFRLEVQGIDKKFTIRNKSIRNTVLLNRFFRFSQFSHKRFQLNLISFQYIFILLHSLKIFPPLQKLEDYGERWWHYASTKVPFKIIILLHPTSYTVLSAVKRLLKK